MFDKLFGRNLFKELRDINKSQRELIHVIDDMNREYAGQQSYSDLAKFPILVEIYLNDKISVTRKNNIFGNMLVFETTMKIGGSFNEHFHPDAIESTEVVSGRIKDLKQGSEYKTNEVIHYDKGEVHDILALEETKLKVIFKP